ncbi:MAG: dephospho-CoA kinase [Phycisphaerales bacterium]
MSPHRGEPAENRPLVIGIAGGIGSGKSTVARAFTDLGCLLYDADAEVAALYRRPEVLREIRSWWGDGVVVDGRPDRAAIARLVFNDPAERDRLQRLLFPLLAEARAALLVRATRDGVLGVVIDAPLLFEAGLDAECDAVVFVDTPRPIRVERVAARSGWDEAELDRRENAQWGLDAKRSRSAYTVDGSQPVAVIRERVSEILRQMIRARSGTA